jgi:hypothetical protein
MLMLAFKGRSLRWKRGSTDSLGVSCVSLGPIWSSEVTDGDHFVG